MERHIADWFPLWETVRSSGMISFLLLSVSVISGMSASLLKKGKWKSHFHTIHQASGWSGFWFALLHGWLLLYDHYSEYHLWDILIPFYSEQHRLENGIGIIALWGLFALLISSDMMKQLPKHWWRKIHKLAFPIYVFSLFHGIMMGTDSQEPWAFIMYLVSASFLLLLICLRAIRLRKSGKMPTPNC